jgi:hypothetical protein
LILTRIGHICRAVTNMHMSAPILVFWALTTGPPCLKYSEDYSCYKTKTSGFCIFIIDFTTTLIS